MIPVRVPAAVTMPVTVGGIRELHSDHPLYATDCPVCDGQLGGEPVTLVFVGICPEDRKESGWTTGGAVAVHAACAGLDPTTPEE